MKLEWKTCLKLAVTLFALYLCIYYWEPVSHALALFVGSLSPILIGFSIAYVLNILMDFYERHYFNKFSHKPLIQKTRTMMCMVAAIISFFAIIALIIRLIVPELILCIKFLVSQIPPLVTSLLDNDFVIKYVPDEVLESLASVNWHQLVARVAQFIASGVGTAAEAIFSAISSFVSVVITVFISIIFSIYFMLGKDKLRKHSKRLMHNYFSKHEHKVSYVVGVFNESFRKFIVGQCLESVILWILCTIGMMIFKFPYAQMIGAFIGFTALIPVAGAYIGAIVGAIMIMTVSPVKALLFILFIIVLQQLEGNLIYPKVVGKSIGLPAIWVLAAITIGGGIMGIFGMLIGVPIFAALYRLVKDDMLRREAMDTTQKSQPSQTQKEQKRCRT